MLILVGNFFVLIENVPEMFDCLEIKSNELNLGTELYNIRIIVIQTDHCDQESL
jgi:hypothetical protein